MDLLFYRIFYNKLVNHFARQVLTVFNRLSSKPYRIGLRGVIPFKFGNKKIYLEMNESSPMANIYWEQPESFEFTPIFRKLIQNVNGFIDIGANIGFYTYLAALENPKTQIYSFEPSLGPIHYLRKNLLHNPSEQVKVFEIALSNKSGEVVFYEEINPKYPYLKHHLSGMSSTLSVESMRAKRSYLVKTQCLDVFLQSHPMPQLDLIKIDTEGTEALVFEGAVDTLKQFMPILICEVLDRKKGIEIESVLKNLDYHFFQLRGKQLYAVPLLMGGDAEDTRNFFLVPPHRISLIREWLADAEHTILQ